MTWLEIIRMRLRLEDSRREAAAQERIRTCTPVSFAELAQPENHVDAGSRQYVPAWAEPLCKLPGK